MIAVTRSDRVAGCLFGMAYGDAMGWPVEFTTSVEVIRRKYPPDGPRDLPLPAIVTDDTQMALAVGQALMQTPRPYTRATLATALEREFLVWMHSPDNTRAPGNTCMSSLQRLEKGSNWLLTTNPESKGCGANMRVQPVGLLTVDEATRAGIAQLQAAITHAHPTALAAADLTAWVVHALLHGLVPADLLDAAIHYAHSQRTVYHHAWLHTLWRRTNADPLVYIAAGWDECLTALDRVRVGLAQRGTYDDPCEVTGDGWVADEALATALLCFLLTPDDPVGVLQRACVTRGDTDSIACIAGSFVGAHLGMAAWPSEWRTRIEYRDDLDRLAEFMNDVRR